MSKEDKQEEELELTFEPLDDIEDSDVAELDELDDDIDDSDDELEEDEDLEEEEDDKDIEDEEADEDEDDSDDSDDKGKDEEEGDEEPASVVETIITQLGYEFSDEELEGLEDTEEGLTRLVDIAGKKVAEDRFSQMVDATPNVKALYEYEQSGGEAEDFIKAFYPQTDYNKVEVSEDDIDSQKEIIRKSLETKGLSEERIKRNLQAIEDSGNLLDEAKDSLNDLRTAQEQEKERIKTQTEQAQKQAREQAEETWNKVEETVKSGNLAGIPISKKQADEFLDFVRVDPDKGYSPRDEKASKLSMEEQLAIDAILFHGFEALNEIIDKKANTKSAKTLRDRLKSTKKRGKSSNQDPDLDKKTATVEDLDFRIDE